MGWLMDRDGVIGARRVDIAPLRATTPATRCADDKTFIKQRSYDEANEWLGFFFTFYCAVCFFSSGEVDSCAMYGFVDGMGLILLVDEMRVI